MNENRLFHKGVWYDAEVSNGLCRGCAFYDIGKVCPSPTMCTGAWRGDHISVVWVKSKDQREEKEQPNRRFMISVFTRKGFVTLYVSFPKLPTSDEIDAKLRELLSEEKWGVLTPIAISPIAG